MEKYSEELERFVKFMHKVQREYEAADKAEKETELAIQDILHAIELEEHTPQEYARLAIAVKGQRQRRRKAKDVKQQLKPLMDLSQSQKKELGQLGQALGEMRKIENGMQDRTYTWRTDVVQKTLVHQSSPGAEGANISEETNAKRKITHSSKFLARMYISTIIGQLPLGMKTDSHSFR